MIGYEVGANYSSELHVPGSGSLGRVHWDVVVPAALDYESEALARLMAREAKKSPTTRLKRVILWPSCSARCPAL
jgi:hypothetical protein